jgi:signal peptidase I
MDRMSVSFNEEQIAYPKWVNVTTSLLLPGLGHFLSGRKSAAFFWFLANLAFSSTAVFLSILPFTTSIVPALVAWSIQLLLWIFTALESCRKPILRQSFGAWGAVCAVIIITSILSVTSRILSFKVFSIPTAAMMPTLMGNRKSPDGKTLGGDHIIVNRWSYRSHSPRRGDIAVFKTDAIALANREMFHISASDIYVKRVVGLPGERIAIQPPSIYVNGKKLIEPKIFESFFSQTNALNSLPPGVSLPQTDEVQLAPDEYFVLGDNFANSLDSRYYGPIKGGHFVGRVIGIYWPPERRGFVQ